MPSFQKNITLRSRSRGFHIITDEILSQVPDIKGFKVGIMNLLLKHTSASITINENADPSVRDDFETFFNRLVPENAELYNHIFEGLDDMTSHIKASIFGNTLSIPISNGKLDLGTWQGIYLCEFRNLPHKRNLTLTIIGDSYE